MKLRYFVVDARGQLCKAPQTAVRDLWEGRCGVDALGSSNTHELYLVSVVCDANLLPRKIYLLRLPLIDGRFTLESRLTLHLYARPDCVTPGELMRHHMAGWPRDFFRQLAVALDVPRAGVEIPLGIGGPLFLAAALRTTPRKALRYLR